MFESEYVIRKSKNKQIGFVLLTGLAILYYFLGPYEKTRIIYKDSPTFTIILGIIFFTLFFHFLNDLIKRKAEITLTSEGIELRDKGFFDWNMIQSFKTIYYRYSDNHEEELILQFTEFADVRFDISYLEKDKDELAELIIKYKGLSKVFYVGHEAE